MKIKEIVTLSEGKYSGPMEPLTAKGTAKNGAVAALETALIRAKKNGTTMNYKNIDAMMQKICQAHNITGQKLHDDFVKAHDLIPDNWIKKQKLKEYKVETVDVDAVHAELLHQHLLSNPALYENREDFQSVREFLKLHTTSPPRVNRHYVYASVQSTPIAQYCTIAHFNKEHRLVKLDGQFAYFDIDGEIKRFPESGTLNGDALAQIYFFNSINEFEHFTTVLGLKFSHYKHATKILDKHTVDENFADGKKPGRKGLAKRVGVNCKQPVSKLRSIAAHSSGERQRMAHWCANMKSGKKK